MGDDVEQTLEALEQDEEDAMEHKGYRAGTFLAGLAIGALIGAGVALLFAPQSGEETRHDVSRRAKRVARDARERYDDLRDRVRHARRERREEADEAGAE